MAAAETESKKHHYVTKAQLRHFAHDAARSKLFVFDKSNSRSYPSTVKNAGSENQFNTIVEGEQRLNFERIFDEADTNGGLIVNQINQHRSLDWMKESDLFKLADLGAIQLLRTKLTRETPGVLTDQLRKILAEFGAHLDDPSLAPPTENDAKLGTIRNFFGRDKHRASFLRLYPGLVEPEGEARFVISDHPVVFSNPFPYGDYGLQSQGIMVHLPIGPKLLLTWHCPTIVARFENLFHFESADQPVLRAYAEGLFTGKPAQINDMEVQRYNALQFAQSRRFIFSHSNNFDTATPRRSDHPETEWRERETLMKLGRLGEGPPPRLRMPDGWTLVVHGPRDHCLLHIEEIDEEGESITARTSNLELLNAAATDPRLDYVELFDGPRQRRHLGQVTIELLTERGPGWFSVVHYDDALRALSHQIDRSRSS